MDLDQIYGWLQVWLPIIAAIAAVIISLYARIFVKKQHKATGLLDAFKIIDSREHRTSRKKVYDLYREYEKNNDLTIFDHVPEVEDVRADFDVIAALIKSGNVDKELFLIEFGPLAYRCWNYLKKHIEAERKKRKFDPFMTNFEWLSDQADKYWKRKGKKLSETALY